MHKNIDIPLLLKMLTFDMSLLYGQPPKIIWLKIGNQTKALMINALLKNRMEIERVLITEDKACVEIY